MLQTDNSKLFLNGAWDFQPIHTDALTLSQPNESWSEIPLIVPSPWNGNAWGGWTNMRDTENIYRCDGIYYPDYPEEWIHARMGWLRRTFEWEKTAGKHSLLHFDAVAGCAEVFINGNKVGEHFDSWLPFSFDITDHLRDGQNEILVGVRNQHVFDVKSKTYKHMRCPYPTGSNTDGLCGIWQDVWVEEVEPIRVTNVFVQPFADSGLLRIAVTITNDSPHSCITTPSVIIREIGLTLSGASVEIASNATETLTLETGDTCTLQYWSPDSPILYHADIYLDKALCFSQRFGWRQFRIEGDKLLLNNETIRLVGDICHPFGPYMFKPEWIRSWYSMIRSVGGNAVRLHAQIYPHIFLDIADEMGICVLDETAFFGSNLSANLEENILWERLNAHYDGLVLRDRNHPSVFGWSFGNELFAFFLYDDAAKRDQEQYWKKIIALGKRSYKLDPSRDFVTCDGDEDLFGNCPVWSKHFGHGIRDLPAINKPKVVGENGGTYYARPSQLAVFNGEASYLSYKGRNNALGIDLYAQIRHIGKNLAYFSPSELVWFGLEPMPYGYHDYTRLPDIDDGIYFAKPEDGVPGIWFGRLPPFAGTLNPGWDTQLPEIKPLDMYYAMKDALTFDEAYDRKWQVTKTTLPNPPHHDKYRTVRFIGEPNGRCAKLLQHMGLVLSPDGEDMIVDGETAVMPVSPYDGNVLIILRDNVPDGLDVKLIDRDATQLERKLPHPWTDSIAVADMYTAEEHSKYIARHGIETTDADVILCAGEADWSQFNNVPEKVKCGAAFLFEHLKKPCGTVLAKLPDGRYVTTVLMEPTDGHFRFWRKLFTNIGWEVHDALPIDKAEAALHDLLMNGPVDA